jgi:class 3 adenylate cyclase/tetratricopeptide (TPR) repeat protein
MNFCGKCGAKLERFCPQCNFGNPTEYEFCGKCGYSLSLPSVPGTKELSFDEKIDKIQRYLPKGLTDKILSQRERIEGERKQVTVMFCDLEGFTVLSERLGPEEAYNIMDEIYEILIHKVHDYEGTVNEMTGDGIMALFGAPIALEDAPQRAIRSAYSVHREIARFSDRIKQVKKNIAPFKMRIGIHTGPVVVGTLGNDLRVEFKAVGDTVNLASRMEGLAEPGATFVTEETFKLTEGFFRFEALGEKEIKGKAAPVKIYRVIAPSTRRTRFDVSAERGLTRFIGRERELELLLDGFERAKEGRGQAISIMAEAGVGKSRLLYEFRKAVANEDVTFLEGKCLSYSRAVAYHPVIDVLISNFDIQVGDADSEITEKVKKGLKAIGADEPSTLPYLLELLSVKDSGIDKIPMSSEARKDRITEAVKRITFRGSEIRPLIIAIEDLHWIDKGSEEYLKDLLDRISGAKVFLVFTYRPEFVHTWGGKSYHSQVTLNRLSNRESNAMVTYILGTEDVDSDLEELILEKTEGVPFFIEEFIKSLKELKIVERKDDKYHLARDIQEVSIPSTIQEVVMARVDSLPEGAKEVLQTGSVIEREFSYELIKHVTGLSEKELLPHLSTLRDSELIYERGIYPESTYIFKHALTHEVVYDSILTKRKKKLHDEIGNAIEEVHKDNIYEYYSVLAEHYIASENYEKGAEYSKLAGKKATRAGSANEAIAYAKKTVSSLERLPRTDDIQKQIIDVRTVLGINLCDLNYFHEAQEAIDPIIDIVLKSDYKKRISQIFTIIGGREFCTEENFPKALEHLEMALQISEEIGDIRSSAFANYWLGYALSLNCEFEEANYHIKKAIKINMLENDLVRINIFKNLLSFLVYYFQGRFNLAYQTNREAFRIAKESGDIYSNSFACACYGISCFGKGFLEEAKNHFLKGVKLCEKINHHYWNAIENHFLGEIYFEIREYQKAKDHYEKSMWFMDLIGWLPSWINLNKIAVSRTKVMNNEKDINLESLYSYVSENKIKQQEGWMRRYIAEIVLNIDEKHMSKAEDWVKEAIKTDKQMGMMFHLAKDYALYAELFKRKGDRSNAIENLSKAIEIFKECGAEGWQAKAEKELTPLS